MKTYFPLLTLFLFYTVGLFGQETRWRSSAYLDLASNHKNVYTYYNANNMVKTKEIAEKGVIELAYHLDYLLSDKIAISAITSYNRFVRLDSSSLKIGSGIKYMYADNKTHYLTLQYGYHIPFKKDSFKEGHQLKIGQIFNVGKPF